MKRLVGILFLETVLIGLLHRLAVMFPVDWANLSVWIQFTPTDQVLMGAFRYLALALTYWLLLSTLSFAFGMIARLPRLVRSVEWATLPVIRNAARRAVALSLATSTMAPTMALVSPTAYASHQTVEDEHPNGDSELGGNDQQPGAVVIGVAGKSAFIPPGATVPRQTPGAEASVPTPRLAKPPSAPGPPSPLLPPVLPLDTQPESVSQASTSHIVERGDNLWTIANEYLKDEYLRAGLPDVPLTEQEIASYWGRLVELNQSRLRSQNPDLIFPGEVIELPPTQG